VKDHDEKAEASPKNNLPGTKRGKPTDAPNCKKEAAPLLMTHSSVKAKTAIARGRQRGKEKPRRRK